MEQRQCLLNLGFNFTASEDVSYLSGGAHLSGGAQTYPTFRVKAAALGASSFSPQINRVWRRLRTDRGAGAAIISIFVIGGYITGFLPQLPSPGNVG